jgi:large subunit ribosomal protein L9
MDIILLERVEKLGGIGDVVSVKDGYARNYLLPNKKALRANDANRKVFEANRARSSRKRRTVAARPKSWARSRRHGNRADPRLVELGPALWFGFGARHRRSGLATNRAMTSTSVMVIMGTPDQDHRHVRRDHSRCTPRSQVTVKANVARSPDEAEQQAQGVDVIAAMFEEDTAPTGFIEAIDPTLEPGEIPADRLTDAVEDDDA